MGEANLVMKELDITLTFKSVSSLRLFCNDVIYAKATR